MIEHVARISGGDFSNELLERAVVVLCGGGVLVHPTATIHGLGCRYDAPQAVERIRALKGRDSGKPMILLVPGRESLRELCENVPEQAERLAGEFWPGPLTIVFRASRSLRDLACWTGGTVALRQCSHPFTGELVASAGLPMVSTSLSLSGESVPRDVEAFLRELAASGSGSEAAIDLAVVDTALDQGSALASTVIAVDTDGVVRILRPGTVTAAMIEERTGMSTIQREK